MVMAHDRCQAVALGYDVGFQGGTHYLARVAVRFSHVGCQHQGEERGSTPHSCHEGWIPWLVESPVGMGEESGEINNRFHLPNVVRSHGAHCFPSPHMLLMESMVADGTTRKEYVVAGAAVAVGRVG